MMLRKAMTVLLGTALLAGCGGGETYPLAAREVRSKLVGLQPPLMVFGGGAGDVRSSQYGDGTVRWVVLGTDGLEIIRFIAKVEDAGDHAAKVSVEMEPPQGRHSARVQQGMNENPAIVNLYKKAMVEQIDAKLENRSFNMAAIQHEMMAATIATMPKMQQAALEASAEMNKMQRQRMDDAYNAEASSSSGGGFSDDASAE